MKKRGFLAVAVVASLVMGCAISVPLDAPRTDRSPAAPFDTLDQPIGLSIPLYLEKQDYYLGYLQKTKVRAGDRLIVWDWKTESVRATTFLDWTYRSLNRGMSGPVVPHTYGSWGAVTSPKGLVFGSSNNSLSEVAQLDAKTGALTQSIIPGPVRALSRVTATGQVLLASWRTEETGTATALRLFDLNNKTLSTGEWPLGTDATGVTSMVLPAFFDGQFFWVVKEVYGEARGDQIWRFDPATTTLELVYTDDRPNSSLVVLGPSPRGTVAARKAQGATSNDLLVFEGTPGKAPTLISVPVSEYQSVVRGFQARGTFYLVRQSIASTLYSVVAVDLTSGVVSGAAMAVDLPSLETLEVRGDQVFFFATPGFGDLEGLRLDLTTGQTVKRYSLLMEQVHNP